ncbi:unnamed protein product [Brassica rapa subsp. trilocularis]
MKLHHHTHFETITRHHHIHFETITRHHHHHRSSSPSRHRGCLSPRSQTPPSLPSLPSAGHHNHHHHHRISDPYSSVSVFTEVATTTVTLVVTTNGGQCI